MSFSPTPQTATMHAIRRAMPLLDSTFIYLPSLPLEPQLHLKNSAYHSSLFILTPFA